MAARSKDIAFVIVRAGSGLPVLDTMAYEVAWSVREAGFDMAQAQLAESASRELFALAARRAPWADIAAVQARHADAAWRDAAGDESPRPAEREWLAPEADSTRDDLAAIRSRALVPRRHDTSAVGTQRRALIEAATRTSRVRIVDAATASPHGDLVTATSSARSHMASVLGFDGTMAARNAASREQALSEGVTEKGVSALRGRGGRAMTADRAPKLRLEGRH